MRSDARRLRWPESGLVALAGATTLTPLLTNDIWVHLAVGRETVRDLLAGNGIPATERFSFSAAGRPLVPHEWLAAVIFYLFHQAAGPAGVLLLRLLLVLATLFFLARAAKSSGAGAGATLWTLLFLLLAVAPRLSERPHLFSFALSAATLALLAQDADRVRDGGSRPVWILVPLLVVWANLHGGFVVGFFLIGASFVGAAFGLLNERAAPTARPDVAAKVACLDLRAEAPSLAEALAAGRDRSEAEARLARGGESSSPGGKRLRRLALVFVVSAAGVALLNPVGTQLFLFPFKMASSPTITEKIYEWRSPLATGYRTSTWFLLTIAWGVLLLGASLVSRNRNREPSSSGWGLAGFAIAIPSAILALRQLRSLGDFVILTSPWMAVSLDRTWRYLRGRDASPRAAGVTAVAAAVLIYAFGYPLWLNTRTRCIPPLIAPWVPVRAADFLASLPDLPEGARIFNSYTTGGYLAWRLDHRARILIDSRNEAYGDELTSEIIDSFADVSAFEVELARWKPHVLLLHWRRMAASPVLPHLDASSFWSLVFLDDHTAIYMPRGAGVAHPRPIRFISPSGYDQDTITPANCAEAIEEGLRLASWQPDGVIAALVRGRALLVAGRSQEAREVLERAAARAPILSPPLWGLLAEGRAAVGDDEGAAEALRRASTGRTRTPAEE